MSNITPLQYREMLLRTRRPVESKPTEGVDREADLHDQVLDYCRGKGWIAVHSRMDKSSTIAVGMPDFVIATDDGRTLWVECKRKNGKPTPAQQAMLHWLARNRQICGVVRSLDEFIALARKEKA
jgi:hypothetical protein